MIVLDTNVVSQFSKNTPNDRVLEWLNLREDHELLITAITVAELRYGVAIMPEGKKKLAMQENVDQTLEEFGGVCVAFDGMAAEEYATIVAARRLAGRPISIHDAQIAAIARSGGFTLATLNKKDFADIEGLKAIDPSA
jgi:predicted nucleic acid-binding protein